MQKIRSQMMRPNFDFDSLKALHDSVNKSLHSTETKFEIINHGQEKYVHEISEASLKMADSCAAAKDLLLLAKDHLHHLQSAFRRVAAATAADHAGKHFAPYRNPRKQLKKAILKRLDSLKGMKNTCIAAAAAAASPPSPAEEELNLVAVEELLSEVRKTTLSMVKSLLTLIALPDPDGKMSSGRKESGFVRLKLTRVDSLGFWESVRGGAWDVGAVAKRLEEVEMVVEDMEIELENMFRRLIRTRASLLNILTT